MRILVVNWSNRKIGGTEDYLNNLLPALVAHGHQIAFAYEVDIPQERGRIGLPENTLSWDMSALGMRETLRLMRAWTPDIIYAHGLLDTQFEAAFLKIAPSVYFAHNYYGTCISGLKTFKFPTVQPCNRKFGPACLLHYFPRQCGGHNPLTMLRLYRRESRRLANLRRYEAVVTHSRHMRDEYAHQGLPEKRLDNFVYEIAPVRHAPDSGNREPEPVLRVGNASRLVFVGRMELLKGGATLLESLPLVVEKLRGPIHLVLAGDGPKRRDWERKAAELQAKHSLLHVEFAGWVDKGRLAVLYANSDLLVVPSLWPEPFGRIGPEAGTYGLPVAAFAVGGVADWLVDGMNGFTAPGDPPTARGLAVAIVKCLRDSALHARLREGAVEVAGRFTMKHHLDALHNLFDRVCQH